MWQFDNHSLKRWWHFNSTNTTRISMMTFILSVFFFSKLLDFFKIFENVHIWNHHWKCITMSTNMIMFGPVVLEIACGIFISKTPGARHAPFIWPLKSADATWYSTQLKLLSGMARINVMTILFGLIVIDYPYRPTNMYRRKGQLIKRELSSLLSKIQIILVRTRKIEHTL